MNAFRHALTPARALLLAALLLLAQAAGLAHRVAHGGSPLPASTVALAGAATAHGHGLGDHEQAGAECRLFDQLLGHADVLPSAAWSGLALGCTASPGIALPAPAVAGPAAAYQARAPPSA